MNWPEWTSPDGRIRLINADCLEVRDSLPPVDAVISDPPYGIKYKSGKNSPRSISSTGKRFSVPIFGDDKPFDPSPWLALGECVFTGAQHFYDRLPPGGGLHCWDKRGNYKPLDQADADFIWCSKKSAARVFHLAWRGICRHSENNCRIEHPTQKPIALMEWCLSFLPGADLILDPFAGSYTTAVACKRQRRRCIAIEKEPKYFEIGVKRMKAEFARTALIEEACA